VKRVGEERYFADDGEFEQFIIKQGGTADEDYGELKIWDYQKITSISYLISTLTV